MNEPVVNKPIRVCFVVLKAYPLFNPKVEKIFGGAEVDAYFLATELAKNRDFKVSLVVGEYGQEPTVEHPAQSRQSNIYQERSLSGNRPGGTILQSQRSHFHLQNFSC